MVKEYLDNLSEVLKSPPPLRKEWADVRDTMIVHTRGVKPTKLLGIVRPNEPPEYLKYRLDTYEPITKDAINKAIDAILRSFISSNYKIGYSKNISEYIQENRFILLDEKCFNEPLTLIQLIIEHIGRFDFDDPNAYLVWLPVNPDDPNILPSKTDKTKQVKVQPMLVDADRILDVSEDAITFKTTETIKVVVDQRTKESKQEPYIFVVTKFVIYRLVPYWDKTQKKTLHHREIWYNMGLTDDDNNPVDDDLAFPFVPAKVLGGNITMNEKGQKYFESFLQAYAAFGNECISSFSDNKVVRVRYNFPFVSIKGDECPTCKGSKKVPSKYAEDKGKLVRCGTCKGEGVFSPFGIHIKRPPASGQSETFASSPFIEFGVPPVDILQHSFEAWQTFLELAKESINLIFTKQAQSGVAKEIDREEKVDMLFKVANNLFDLVKFSMDCIECYLVRLKDDRKLEDNILRLPTSFSIKTQDDLFLELNDLMTKDAPAPFIINTAIQLSNKIYNGDLVMQKVIEALTIWDTLFGVTSNNISTLKATGTIGDKEIFRHVYGYQILVKLSRIGDTFAEQPIEKIIEQAEKELFPLIPVKTPLVNALGQEGIEL